MFLETRRTAADRRDSRAADARARVSSHLAQAAPIILVVAGLLAKMLYFSFAAAPDSEWFQPWWIRQALLASAGSMGPLLLLSGAVLLTRPRIRLAIAWVGGFVLTLVLYADILYFRYFGDVLSVAALGAAGQLGMITESIVALIQPADVLLFADLLAFPFLARKRVTAASPPNLSASLLVVGAGVLLSVYPVVTLLDRGEYDYLKLRGAAKIGVLNYHVYDALRQTYLAAAAAPIGETERERVHAFLKRGAQAEAAKSNLFGIARGKNLIMVMVESLHAFPLGLVIDGREVTPHLNRLAKRSLRFASFYDQTWHGVTSDGEFTALQSLHPLPEGGVPTRYGTNRFFALPHVLRANGYSTVSAHGYSGAIWMMSAIHPRYGFEHSWFGEDFEQNERIGMGLSDASFFRQLLPRLHTRREPFMAYVVTLSTHFPFPLPPELRQPGLAVPEGTLVASYLQSVYQFDRAFGELMAGLESSGLLDRSILVLFGDHGAFSDDAALDDLLSRYAAYPERRPGFDHRYWLAEKRLPLLIHLPGDSAAGVYSGSAGQVDIAPTLLGLLGVTGPRMVALGRDLTAGGNSLVVFRDGSFVIGDTVCIPPSSAPSSEQCREVREGRSLDPGALRPVGEEARLRLEVSDILLAGDLIPWASRLESR